MTWLHTGGGWYEDEDTGDRVRGKKNIPGDEQPQTGPVDVADPADVIGIIRAMCSICSSKTLHDVTRSTLTCRQCGERTGR